MTTDIPAKPDSSFIPYGRQEAEGPLPDGRGSALALPGPLWAIEEMAMAGLLLELKARSEGRHEAGGQSEGGRDHQLEAGATLPLASHLMPSSRLRNTPTPARWLPMGVTPEGVAVIEIDGVMSKRAGWWGDAATVEITQAVNEAAAEPAVKSILLRIDSPGGVTDGLAELGDAVYAARAVKPVVAHIDGMGASAAYYVASQANHITAGRQDLVGSIGVRMLMYDWSKWFSEAGVEAVVIDTGEFKSAGAMGTEITEEQREHFQEIVDSFFEDFKGVIQRGRGMTHSQVADVADGRMFTAEDAMRSGLIDAVGTFDGTLRAMTGVGKDEGLRMTDEAEPRRADSSGLLQSAEVLSQEENMTMSKTTKDVTGTNDTSSQAPAAATVDEMVAACPGADDSFLVGQSKAHATLEQAKGAWTSHLQEQVAAAKKENAELKAKAEEVTKKPGGVQPVGGGLNPAAAAGGSAGDVSGDPVADFDAAVRERVKGGMERRKAVAAVCRANPDLHQAFTLANNPGAQRERLVNEKFEAVA